MPRIRTKNPPIKSLPVRTPQRGPAVGKCPRCRSAHLVPKTEPNGARVGHCPRCGGKFQATDLSA